jgi:hypothetical protein
MSVYISSATPYSSWLYNGPYLWRQLLPRTTTELGPTLHYTFMWKNVLSTNHVSDTSSYTWDREGFKTGQVSRLFALEKHVNSITERIETPLTRILKVLSSNLGSQTGYPDGDYSYFYPVFPEKFQDSTSIRTQPLPSESFQILCLVIILPCLSPGQVMWDLWHWGRFSPSTLVSPPNSHSNYCSTITIIYHLWLVQ